MKLLHVIPSVDPRGGGPIEGIRQIGRAIRPAGGSIDVLTLDDPRAAHVRNFDLPVHALGPSLAKYRFNPKLVRWLREHAQSYDAIIINGLWQYHAFGTWLALRKLKTPYVVFTHGMLDPWFKRTYPLKHLKKWLYWPWADYRVLRDAHAVVFTCEEERRLARESFWLYRVREAVVAYGTSAAPDDTERLREVFLSTYPALRGKRIVLFISRIHEKKGCDLLIEAFGRVAADHADLRLVMAGPDQTNWQPTLERLARAHGVADRITWTGMIGGDLRWGAYYASQAMALPSHQENFGFVVVEALACGIPALISNRVNIWREVEADGAAFVGDDTVDATETNLRRWLALSDAERGDMATRARASFDSRFTADAMVRSLLTILQAARS
jgi:glycosyltransferase involved in cell wall biosynthesis